MNTKIAEKVFRVSIVFAFFLGITWVPSATARAQEPIPTFTARLTSNRIDNLWDWPDGAVLTLAIDHPDTSQYPDYTEMKPYDSDNGTSFTLEDFRLKIGDLVTLTDGNTTKSTTVANVNITEVNLENETISGTADPFTNVSVHIWLAGLSRLVQADENGHWLAGFSEEYDLRAGNNGVVSIEDEDGDVTTEYWHVNYTLTRIEARPNIDQIKIWWPVDATVTIEIDDPATSQIPDYTDNTTFDYDPSGGTNLTEVWIDIRDYDLKIGDLITVTDGTTTKQHVVSNLMITSVDLDADIVYGVAEPYQTGDVRSWGESGVVWRYLTADQDGYWSANFAVPGELDGEHKIIDLHPGSQIEPSFYDDDCDSTVLYGWQVLAPDITAAPSNDWINGEEWPVNATVTIEIDDPDTPENPDFSTTQIATEDGGNPGQRGGQFHYWSEYDFSLDDIITLSDGITTKSLVVSDIQITLIDVENDLVTGTTDPDRDIWFFIHDDIDGKQLQSDSSGNWSVSFAGEYDIRPGTEGSLKVFDDDGDKTHADWQVFNPTMDTYPANDRVEGWEWPEGTTVDLEIDDPATPENPDYADAVIVESSDWHPLAETWIIGFDFQDLYDLKAGDIVTQTDGVITKLHVVTELTITDVDLDNDIVSGMANPDSVIYIWIHLESGQVRRDEVADLNGSWSVSFAVPGDSDWDRGTADIQPGTRILAGQSDDDYDWTMYRWDVPIDTDGDGIADNIDSCPNENASSYDANQDGCIDTANGLVSLLEDMPDDEIATNIKKPLLKKVSNVIKSLEKGNTNSAINQMEAFINQVEAQRGKKISEDAADLLVVFAENIIARIL